VWAFIVLAVVLAVDGPRLAETSGTIVFWVIAAPWLLMRALDWIFCGEVGWGSRIG